MVTGDASGLVRAIRARCHPAYPGTMEGRRLGASDRKALGGLLLAVVLFTAVVLPNLAPKEVPGSPSARLLPGPPEVGQCVLKPPVTPIGASALDIVSASVLSYGFCSGRHVGEVVKVVSTDTIDSSDGRLDASAQQTCGAAAVEYLGLGSLLPARPQKVDVWSPVIYDGATAGIPDREQQAGGQHWIACTLIPRIASPQNGYYGVIRNVMRTGSPPATIGLCSDDAVAELDGGVPCDRPHRYQIFGEATANNASSVAELTATCERLVKSATGMPDTTAHGRLRVEVSFMVWRVSAGILTASAPMAVPDQQGASCALGTVGTARLTGSVLGIGTAVVPVRG
jgi:hypothetical protein